MSKNESLVEEREAVTSIYDYQVLTLSDTDGLGSTTAILALPNIAYSFTLIFPSTYPDDPPSVTGTHHVAASAKKGEGEAASNILRDVLGRIFTPGQVCLFDLIEEATPLLAEHHDVQSNGTAQDPEEHVTIRSATPPLSQNIFESPSDALTAAPSAAAVANIPSPDWVLSEPLVVNKSTFVARCVRVASLSEATTSISHLLATNKKVAAATHNITAWRIKQVQVPAGTGRHNASQDGPEIVIQDSDDDGETAAGGRLLHLMQLMDVWNVVVVVTRWYGGVKLGPDRFRCINAVAREALVNGGFVKAEKESGRGGGKKGRK